MSTPRPFPVDARLTGITLAYTNKSLIADAVLPRVQVGGQTFRFWRYDHTQFMTVPNTLVGRKGRPNEVEFGATEDAGQVYDYGLDDVVPNDDVTAAQQSGNSWDPIGMATQGLTDLILLDREVRVARLVFNPATYPTANKEQNTSGDYWDDPDSDPVTQIMDVLETPLVRPNLAVFSQKVYDRLRTHPKVVAAAYATGGNAATGGVVTRDALARVLEIERIEVGQSYVNTAKPGQTPTVTRTWGNHAAFLHINPLANSRSAQATFGYTAQWQGRVSGTIPEPQTGLRGATRVRVGESVNELVVMSGAGYFIEDAIDPS